MLMNRASRATLLSLLSLLLFMAAFALSAASADSLFFDWRSVYRQAPRLFLPKRETKLNFPHGFRTNARELCIMLSYNGFGAPIVREMAFDAAKAASGAPSAAEWLEYAYGKKELRTLPVVGLGRTGTASLALIFHSALSDNPQKSLTSVDLARIQSEKILPAYLYCLSLKAVQLDAALLENWYGKVSEYDAAFLAAIAGKNAKPFRNILVAALDSNSPLKRAYALLALSFLPANERDADFARWAGAVLNSRDLWAMRLAALAAYRVAQPDVSLLFEPYILSNDIASATFAAIAFGSAGPYEKIRALSVRKGLNPIIKGHILLGAAKRAGGNWETSFFSSFTESGDPLIRQLAAIALGMRADPASVPKLRALFQDAAYDVRAASIVAAGLLKPRYSFGLLKDFVQDKHHEELSALASLLLAQGRGKATTRLLSGVNEYIFDREKAMGLLALGAASPDTFLKEAQRYRNRTPPYLQRLLSIGALYGGKGEYLHCFTRAIREFQEYRPFGHPAALRYEAVRELIPPLFAYLLNYCVER